MELKNDGTKSYATSIVTLLAIAAMLASPLIVYICGGGDMEVQRFIDSFNTTESHKVIGEWKDLVSIDW